MPLIIQKLDYQPQWEETGGDDPRSRLLAHFEMLGTTFHLEAIEVHYEETEAFSGWRAKNFNFENNINDLAAISGDGNFTTTQIDGRQYILMAYPFCT